MHSRPVRSIASRVALLAGGLFLAWLAYVFRVLQPSNDRDWEYGMDVLPDIRIADGTVSVRNVRDFRWTTDGPAGSNRIDRAFAVDRIARVWFVKEPFTIPPFTGFDGVAHTYFVFDFEDQPPVAISVEARRERGEAYDAVHGLLNTYELIYIWGTEPDLTGSRAVLEKHQLYMYPLNIPGDAAQRLFLNLAEASQQLETRPRFYNSLTSNCTNELAKAANMVKPGAIPPNIALVLPGYADKVLAELGFIPNDAPLEEVRRRYSISDIVAATYAQPDFSSLLRARLTSSPAPK